MIKHETDHLSFLVYLQSSTITWASCWKRGRNPLCTQMKMNQKMRMLGKMIKAFSGSISIFVFFRIICNIPVCLWNMVISILETFELAVNFLINITSDTDKINFSVLECMRCLYVTNPESKLQCYNANVNTVFLLYIVTIYWI